MVSAMAMTHRLHELHLLSDWNYRTTCVALSRDGYRDFGSVERKSGRLYKLDARDAQGRKIELDVDARTAEVLASEADEDDDD